jgi:hypothetical protein
MLVLWRYSQFWKLESCKRSLASKNKVVAVLAVSDVLRLFYWDFTGVSHNGALFMSTNQQKMTVRNYRNCTNCCPPCWLLPNCCKWKNIQFTVITVNFFAVCKVTLGHCECIQELTALGVFQTLGLYVSGYLYLFGRWRVLMNGREWPKVVVKFQLARNRSTIL